MYSYSLGTPRSSSFSQSPLKASSKVRNRADFKWWILKLYVFIKHESKLSQWFFLVWNDFGWCWCSMWGFVSEIYYFVLLRLALCFPGAHANGAGHSCLSFCNIQTSPPQPQHISLSESFVYAANFQDSNAFNTLIAKYNILFIHYHNWFDRKRDFKHNSAAHFQLAHIVLSTSKGYLWLFK